MVKVHIKPFRILHICDVEHISRQIAIYFLREKLHLHGLFGSKSESFL